jgi:hypothetical protein
MLNLFHLKSALPRMVRRLVRSRRGVTAIVFAIALLVLFGFAGLAIDVGDWLSTTRNVQSTAVGGSASGSITVRPGIDIIAGGSLTFNSKAAVTGDGVTFVLTGDGTRLRYDYRQWWPPEFCVADRAGQRTDRRAGFSSRTATHQAEAPARAAGGKPRRLQRAYRISRGVSTVPGLIPVPPQLDWDFRDASKGMTYGRSADCIYQHLSCSVHHQNTPVA